MNALVLSVVLAQAYYTPQEAADIFAQANARYAQGDPAGAAEGYQRLLDRGFGGSDVLFNLGTAHLAQGRLGEAVLSLERARRQGGGEDVEAHLAMARAQQVDQVVGAQAEEPFLHRLALATPQAGVCYAFLVFWTLGFAALLARKSLSARRGTWLAAAVVCFLLAGVTGALVATHMYVQERWREAVVLPSALQVRELPQELAKTSFEVHAGLKVRLLESAGNFVRIRLPNGLEGWVQKEGVGEI